MANSKEGTALKRFRFTEGRSLSTTRRGGGGSPVRRRQVSALQLPAPRRVLSPRFLVATRGKLGLGRAPSSARRRGQSRARRGLGGEPSGGEQRSNLGFPSCSLSELSLSVLLLVLGNPSPPKGRELGHPVEAPPTTDLGELGQSVARRPLPAASAKVGRAELRTGPGALAGEGFKPAKTYVEVRGAHTRTVWPHLPRLLGPRGSARGKLEHALVSRPAPQKYRFPT
jgi:hypothetical protein